MTIELKEVGAEKGEPSSTFLRQPLVDSLRSDNASGNDKQYLLRGISKGEEKERGK